MQRAASARRSARCGDLHREAEGGSLNDHNARVRAAAAGLDVAALMDEAVLDLLGETPRFRLLTVADLYALPDPTWLIKDWLPAGALATLFGAWGSGKSFLALDWALSVATGVAWLGCPATPGTVLYVAAEAGLGLKPRVASWMTAHRVAEPDAVPIRFLREPVTLSAPEDTTALLAAIEAAVLPSVPRFVVLDTLARMSTGLDENKQADMGQLIHHQPYSDMRMRGSSVLPAAMDTILALTKDGSALTLSVTKQKDAEPTVPRFLKLTPLDGSLIVDGDPSRAQSLWDRIRLHLTANPGASFTALHRAVAGHEDSLRQELTAREQVGDVRVARGRPGQASHYTLAPGMADAF